MRGHRRATSTAPASATAASATAEAKIPIAKVVTLALRTWRTPAANPIGGVASTTRARNETGPVQRRRRATATAARAYTTIWTITKMVLTGPVALSRKIASDVVAANASNRPSSTVMSPASVMAVPVIDAGVSIPKWSSTVGAMSGSDT